MNENQNDSPQKVKTLKIIRRDNSHSYKTYYNQDLAEDPDYEYGTNTFLHTLYLVIDDFGHYMPTILNDKLTNFGGNSTWGKIGQNNTFQFGDDFEDITFEMNFDEFLSINNEYQKLCKTIVDEIIFKRVGNNVAIEGIWHNAINF